MISAPWIQFIGPTLAVSTAPRGYGSILSPAMARSTHSALSDLQLDRLFIVYPADARFSLYDRVEVVRLILPCTEGL